MQLKGLKHKNNAVFYCIARICVYDCHHLKDILKGGGGGGGAADNYNCTTALPEIKFAE